VQLDNGKGTTVAFATHIDVTEHTGFLQVAAEATFKAVNMDVAGQKTNVNISYHMHTRRDKPLSTAIIKLDDMLKKSSKDADELELVGTRQHLFRV
jgi:hypothetical protein